MRADSVPLIVNRRNVKFLLDDVFDLESVLAHPRFAAHDRASVEAVLDSAEDIAQSYFLPCAVQLDANEPVLDRDGARVPLEAHRAINAYREAGFFAAQFDESDGGAQIPASIMVQVNSMFAASNISLFNYCFLTSAAANMLAAFGSSTLRETFLPNMLAGRWFGTMCLSEPQAGSSLADVRTSATPLGNSRFSIAGNKMWISGGDHDLAENIVHMVLARIDGSPPGVGGLSLFLTPKYCVNSDGSLGQTNNIALAGLNHKMGQRGTTNCLLNFGEQGVCVGELIGEPNKGLAHMFHMMNEARIIVGANAAAIGNAGYLCAVEYAKTRLQGRAAAGKQPSNPQTAIINHADVRRMLLKQRAAVEGALALATYCGILVDKLRGSDAASDRARVSALLDLLTPIAKTWASEHCTEANALAIQVLGGYGYTRDFPVERHYRDNRLNPIHEGTTGIQGIDLLGRKVRATNRSAFNQLVELVQETISEASARPEIQEEAHSLGVRLANLVNATDAALNAAEFERSVANATLYLDAAGQIVIGWMWLLQAIPAVDSLRVEKTSDGERAFYQGKRDTCRYYFRYELPRIDHQLALVASLDATCLAFQPEYFTA
jgi:butyryl-CoA dehydrogenase